MSVKLAVNCSIMFKELPLLERPKAAKDAGFDAIEFWWPFPNAEPTEQEVETFIEAVRAADVNLIGLNFFAGDMPAGERGVLCNPDRVAEFRSSVEIASEIGKELGCKAFNALYGLVPQAELLAVHDQTAINNLVFAADTVKSFDGRILLEPVSGAPDYPLKTASDVATVIETFQSNSSNDNVRLLCDFYHLAVNGDNLEQVVSEYHGQIGHIQIADSPGRHQPGTGTLDILSPLKLAHERGYDGYVAMEYVPDGPTVDSFAWLSDFQTILREQE